ncbi:MAG TPA: MinD/ParA family protein [Alphaproteobacteria bacterium]|nr:cobyrinic acid a,c-diamide synthase [Rhodospirillaceae bacterium]HRJ11658.1 MinD/ParA family protein [Alphaproteobacteria bacterium]
MTTINKPNIIAIASGKGGVGKTWLSATLCHVLASSGKRVLLFDGDLGLANVDVQLGLSAKHDLQHVVDGKISLKSAITKYAAGGFDIIAGRSGAGGLASIPAAALQNICQDLLAMADQYDHVIIDLGAGVDRVVRQLAAMAALTLVITNDEPTSITDAYAFIKLGHQAATGTEFRIIVNSAQTREEGQKTADALQQACTKFLNFKPELAGIVRRDTKVRDAIRAQMPLLTRSPTSEALADVENIAKHLGGKT